MKTAVELCISVCLFIFAGCVMEQPLDWNQVQDVGGIRIGNAGVSGDTWFIPVYCNLSGLETVSVKPKTVNSGIVFKEYRYRIVKDRILMSIIASLPDAAHGTASSGNGGILLKIKSLEFREYALFYENRDGSVEYVSAVALK